MSIIISWKKYIIYHKSFPHIPMSISWFFCKDFFKSNFLIGCFELAVCLQFINKTCFSIYYLYQLIEGGKSWACNIKPNCVFLNQSSLITTIYFRKKENVSFKFHAKNHWRSDKKFVINNKMHVCSCFASTNHNPRC